jgi:hypothetical protein
MYRLYDEILCLSLFVKKLGLYFVVLEVAAVLRERESVCVCVCVCVCERERENRVCLRMIVFVMGFQECILS